MRVALRRAYRSARFAWKIQRFEFVAVLVVGLGLMGLSLWEIVRLAAVTPAVACFKTWFATAQAAPGCERLFDFFDLLNGEGGQLTGLLTIFPVFVGAVLGTTLVSHEIESRTAELAWALVTTRRRWLLDRIWPVLLFAVLVCGIAAVVGDALQQATAPWIGAGVSFHDYGGRGLPLVARGVALTTMCLAIGAIVGRQLPALLIGFAASAVLVLAIQRALPFGAPLVPVAVGDPFSQPLVLMEAYKASDGTLLSRDQARAAAPPSVSRGDLDEWVFGHFEIVRLGVPGEELAAVELRESVVLLLPAAAFLALAIVVVNRRRPY